MGMLLDSPLLGAGSAVYTGPTVIGSAIKAVNGAATSVSIAQADFDVAPSSGDKVILYPAIHYDGKNGAVTPPAGFVGSDVAFDGSGSDQYFGQAFIKTAGGSEGTYTFAYTFPAGGGGAITALVLRGGASPPPARDNGLAGNPIGGTGPMTPNVNNTLIPFFVSAKGGPTPVISSPTTGGVWTLIRTNTNGALSQSKLWVQQQTVAAALTGTVTITPTPNLWFGLIQSWK